LLTAANDVDEHLNVNVEGGVVVIALPEMAAPVTPTKIRIGGNVQSANLIRKVTPVYPPLAKQARIQGVVRFTVTIGKDGAVQDVQLVSGHPLLVSPAQDAVWQWQYKPTLLNGQPVDVVTTVDVNFTLTPDPETVPQ
jgi:protein TonB